MGCTERIIIMKVVRDSRSLGSTTLQLSWEFLNETLMTYWLHSHWLPNICKFRLKISYITHPLKQWFPTCGARETVARGGACNCFQNFRIFFWYRSLWAVGALNYAQAYGLGLHIYLSVSVGKEPGGAYLLSRYGWPLAPRSSSALC